MESLLGLPRLSPQQFDAKSVHKILIIRQHDQLGDFLLSTPVFKAVRAKFPAAHIAVIARKYTASMAQNHQYLDAVIPFYENLKDWQPRYFVWFWRQLRSGYDLAIVLNTVSHSLTSDLLARISGARYVLGSEHRLFTGTKRNFFYNLIAPYQDGARHQSECNLDIVRFLGMDSDDLREDVTLTRQEREWAFEHLRRLGWNPQKMLIAIHPGAGKLSNRWPAQKFANVGEKLARLHDAQVLAAWGSKEDELGRQLLESLNHAAFAVTHLKLRELAAIFSFSNLLLCNDTGVMHVAASVGTPLVAVFGPTEPDQWKPFGGKFVAVRADDFRCASVTPNQVFEAASALICRKT